MSQHADGQHRAEPGSARALSPDDLQRSPGLAGAQARVLGLLGQEVATAWEPALRALLPGEPNLRALPVEPSGAQALATRPLAAVGFDLAPYGCQGLLCLDPALAFGLVEWALGSRHLGPPPDRPLTALESALLRRLATPLLAEYGTAWGRLAELACTPTEVLSAEEAQRRLTEIDSCVCPFEVAAEGVSGLLWVCLPLAGAEPLLSRLSLETWVSGSSTPGQEPQLLAVLEASRIAIRAVLGTTPVTLGEVSRLTAGDLIFLPGMDEQSVSIHISDRPRFVGKVRDHHGRLVVELT
jgi:flagellar motor switch protein FliM